MSDLTEPRFEFQTTRFRDELVNIRATDAVDSLLQGCTNYEGQSKGAAFVVIQFYYML